VTATKGLEFEDFYIKRELILGSRQDIPACKSDWYRLFLNWRRLFEPSFEYTHHQFAFDIEVFEFQAFRSSGRDDTSRSYRQGYLGASQEWHRKNSSFR
jgi:hypothetical protein